LAQSYTATNRNEHIFKAIFEVDENVAPFILKKTERECASFLQILDNHSEFPKFPVAK
jgi:ATP-dependent Clp protease ATP-binding subunit ClpB